MSKFSRSLISLAFLGLYALTAFAYAQGSNQNINLARAQLEAGQAKKALSSINQSLKAEPNDTAALFLKAKILSANKQNKAAIQTYQALIQLEPKRIEAYNNLAALYAQNGDLKQASQTLENAIKSDPVFATIFNNLRAIYSNMSQTHYRAALKLKPKKDPVQIVAINTSQGSELLLGDTAKPSSNNMQASIDAAKRTKADIPKSTPELVSKVSEKPKAVVVSTAKKAQNAVKTEKKAKPKPAKNNAIEVKKALLTWANAWSNRDSATYIQQYVPSYKTAGNSHKKWAAGRRWNFKTRKFIKVNLSNIVIESSGKNYTARFRQSYESNTFKDTIGKELRFTLSNKRWKISKETIL